MALWHEPPMVAAAGDVSGRQVQHHQWLGGVAYDGTAPHQANAARAFCELPAADGDGTVRAVNSPVRFSAFDTTPRRGVPGLGEHTDEILLEAGISRDELGRLREQGVLG